MCKVIVVHDREKTDRLFGAVIRESLMVFVSAMEQELQDNDHKPGWVDEEYVFLEDRLDKQVEELHEVVDCCNATLVKKQCCDVANFAMMIFDKISKEEDEDGQPNPPQR